MKLFTNKEGRVGGADTRSRTWDLRITNALLYQLSYIGFESGHEREPRGKRLKLCG